MTGLDAIAFPEQIEFLLCDADGTLFASEEPAFEASAEVTNALLAELGVARRYTATQLRLATSGRNFRATAAALAAAAGAELEPGLLEAWVARERDAVTVHLAHRLAPDPAVRDVLERCAERTELAVVTSSARVRLDACLEVSGLSDLFAPDRRFSAEDSLEVPRSKPSPAIYRHATERLGVSADRALAVEDTASGALSAVAAGVPVLGFVCFVAAAERAQRVAELEAAGAVDVAHTWAGVQRRVAGTVLTGAAGAAG